MLHNTNAFFCNDIKDGRSHNTNALKWRSRTGRGSGA